MRHFLKVLMYFVFTAPGQIRDLCPVLFSSDERKTLTAEFLAVWLWPSDGVTMSTVRLRFRNKMAVMYRVSVKPTLLKLKTETCSASETCLNKIGNVHAT